MNTVEVTGTEAKSADLNHLEKTLGISVQFLRISIKLMKRGAK
jgi:hypothetical protein